MNKRLLSPWKLALLLPAFLACENQKKESSDSTETAEEIQGQDRPRISRTLCERADGALQAHRFKSAELLLATIAADADFYGSVLCFE